MEKEQEDELCPSRQAIRLQATMSQDPTFGHFPEDRTIQGAGILPGAGHSPGVGIVQKPRLYKEPTIIKEPALSNESGLSRGLFHVPDGSQAGLSLSRHC